MEACWGRGRQLPCSPVSAFDNDNCTHSRQRLVIIRAKGASSESSKSKRRGTVMLKQD